MRRSGEFRNAVPRCGTAGKYCVVPRFALVMASRFFAPGGQRAEKVDQLFTAIAPRYDLINDLQSLGLHRYWKQRVVRLARVRPGDRALDVCCGTGDLALALARRGAQTVGLDFNIEMLRIAERRKSKVQGPKSKVGESDEWRVA